MLQKFRASRHEDNEQYRVRVVRHDGRAFYEKFTDEVSACNCARKAGSRPEVWDTYRKTWHMMMFPEERACG